MEIQKTDITICLGSSCFARGNKKIVTVVKQYIKENKLDDVVYFHGNHCFDLCYEGPVIRINNKIYKGIDETGIVKILDSHFYKN